MLDFMHFTEKLCNNMYKLFICSLTRLRCDLDYNKTIKIYFSILDYIYQKELYLLTYNMQATQIIVHKNRKIKTGMYTFDIIVSKDCMIIVLIRKP